MRDPYTRDSIIHLVAPKLIPLPAAIQDRHCIIPSSSAQLKTPSNRYVHSSTNVHTITSTSPSHQLSHAN
ncbi:hypothetical protein K443DRAFT_347217 [Laccaria amethystina LaAM-08-1]|uniref:Uncharacterized protein n=1 Tax=Laccaria amethystina LaAM-08-1 TaxID=1095629 RepID=A0A0C9WJL4_9AGAR|nr:hypothetical protein K443DRAFT_347217 [Laccaria amethystina LaAM-08-1]